MACRPAHPDTLASLHEIRQQADARGDHCVAVLLDGVALFASLGRELELLEAMRAMTREIAPAVAGTPTAAELDRLMRADGEAESPR